MANKTYKPKRSIERRYQRVILRNNNVLVGCGSLKKFVWEKHDWFCVCCWNKDWLFKHDDRAKFIFNLLTVDSKHIYSKRRANLTCTEVSPKVYGRIWVVLKISTFWFSYFNSGLFAGLYNIFFLHHARIRSHSRKGITCYSLGQALSFKLYRN